MTTVAVEWFDNFVRLVQNIEREEDDDRQKHVFVKKKQQTEGVNDYENPEIQGQNSFSKISGNKTRVWISFPEKKIVFITRILK